MYGTVPYCNSHTIQDRTILHGIIRETATSTIYRISQGTKRLLMMRVAGGVLRLSNSLVVSRLERVLDFFWRSFFCAYVTGTSTFAETSVAYAATDTCLVKVQPWIFLFNLHFYIPQVFVACGGGGSCEFAAAATAKVEIWRRPNAVWGSQVVNGSNAELYLLLSEHRREKMPWMEQISWF